MRKQIILLAAILFIGSVAHASGGGEGHAVASWSDVAMPLVFRSINFLIFVTGLVVLLKKPLRTYLQDRRKTVEEVIKASAERKAWAEQMVADYDRRLDAIGKELETIKASLEQEGHAEAKKILEHANRLAETYRKETSMILDAEWEDLKTELRHKAVEQAVAAASSAVKSALRDEDRERLAREFLDQVDGARKGQGANA